MINIGTILASAIFGVPANIVAEVGTPFMATLVWIVAGLLSWCGAAAIAELGVLYPEAGGENVYLEKAYRRLAGQHSDRGSSGFTVRSRHQGRGDPFVFLLDQVKRSYRYLAQQLLYSPACCGS